MRSRPPTPRRTALVAVLGLVAAAAQAGAPLFKWVDASGVTHYSDVPPPQGAERLEPGTAQSYHAPGITALADPRAKAKVAAAAAYELSVTTPAEGAVLWNADGRIPVGASVTPGLAVGHTLWFVLDGARHSADGALSTELEVPRGEHTLAVTITDAQGADVASSPPVRFAVRQNSSISPPRGPALPARKSKLP